MKKLLIALMVVFLSGCATTSQKGFSLVKGTQNADLHGIKVYANEPSAEYTYTSLGELEVVGTGFSSATKKDEGLTKITAKAREMGANAVINAEQQVICPRRTRMLGEAVVFETLPPEGQME